MIDQKIFTVAEITRDIKELLETSFPTLWIQGEISNFRRQSSGHLYFTLKDEYAQISCVMWRGRSYGLFFTPQDGMKVVAQGDIRVYERGGHYQLDIIQLQPAGVGELQLSFERLKRRLKDEGLFDEAFKKPIPKFPEAIGIVTSPTGAAIRDLASVIGRRFPAVRLVLYPAAVQGEGAAEEIARGIEAFNRYRKVDVLVVGRGGGSLEDLWPFNEERVARAIFASGIPIISAVGHEIDFTIADFVADRRAPTPSAAGEMVVRDREDLLRIIEGLEKSIRLRIEQAIASKRERIMAIERGYALRRPLDLCQNSWQRLDELSRAIKLSLTHLLNLKGQRVAHLKEKLSALNPEALLKKGFSLCYKWPENLLVNTSNLLGVNDQIRVKFYKGEIRGEVTLVD